jgi:hypothetical protein
LPLDVAVQKGTFCFIFKSFWCIVFVIYFYFCNFFTKSRPREA